MKIISNSSILLMIILGFIIGTSFLVSDSYSDHMTVSVSTPQGTSVPGCEETNDKLPLYFSKIINHGIDTVFNFNAKNK